MQLHWMNTKAFKSQQGRWQHHQSIIKYNSLVISYKSSKAMWEICVTNVCLLTCCNRVSELNSVSPIHERIISHAFIFRVVLTTYDAFQNNTFFLLCFTEENDGVEIITALIKNLTNPLRQIVFCFSFLFELKTFSIFFNEY